MSTTLAYQPQAVPPPPRPRPNYLNVAFGVKSWLLTTDHKRIAILYLVSVTLMFFIGGAAATLVRINLLTPDGGLMAADTYNKTFTLHGIIMVFFFLVPVVPTILGNFCLPLMIGAKDLAFPRLNLLSWYVFMLGAIWVLIAIIAGGVDTGWTYYTPYSSRSSHYNVVPTMIGVPAGIASRTTLTRATRSVPSSAAASPVEPAMTIERIPAAASSPASAAVASRSTSPSSWNSVTSATPTPSKTVMPS